MSKPSTPVRRSKVGPGRPGSAGGEIPLTASMEVLTPDPSMPPLMAAADVGRSQEIHAGVNGSKPRTPGSAALNRTRSTDGRRSSHGPHEVISLTSTTSKSFSANHILAHPPGSPAASVLSSVALGALPHSPYSMGPGGLHMPPNIGCSQLQIHVVHSHSAHARASPDIGLSQASSRFNPVTEGDDDMPPLQPHQSAGGSSASYLQGGEAGPRESHVVVGGSAAAVAQRAAVAAGGSRRYDAAESVAFSMQQQQQQRLDGGVGAAGFVGDGEEGGVLGGYRREDESVPGTPASVASGRVGGIFFTDLHRSFGSAGRRGVGESQDLAGTLGLEGDDEGPRASRLGPRASTVSTLLNPMQSPSASEDGDDEDDAAFAEYAGDGATERGRGGEGGEGAEARGAGANTGDDPRSSISALTDYSNPLQTPYESRLSTPLLPAADRAASDAARKSLLLVIRDLYVTEQPQPQQQPEEEGEGEPSRPATAASLPPQTPLPPAGEGEGEGGVEEGNDVAASRAAVAALAARSDSRQSQRRSELGEYMAALQGLKDDAGDKLVELPPDWGIMLERLFKQRRAEFATLEGWLGPRRFEDLPINQLPSEHSDPRVEEGLKRIRELDTVLNDKLIEALISHRETFPEQWAAQERKRLDRHSRGVEEALKRERQKRMRAARLSRAVTSLDGPASLAGMSYADDLTSQGSMQSLAEQPSVYSRMFVLKPEEEALVEHVLQRNDEEGAAINPFDLDSAATYGGGAVGDGNAAAGDADADVDGSVADVDDIELELDMLLPSASCCTTPSAAAAPMPRPFSARLLDPDTGGGGGGGSRPQSASSYSMSRPGTSSGLGGLSAIASAALHGHPALLAAAAASSRASTSGGLLPDRVYDDPRVAARALRAINARLAAFESEHLWDESGGLADFKSLTERPPPPLAAAEASVASAGTPSVAPTAAAAAGLPPRPPSPTRSARSAAGGPAESLTGVSMTEGGQRDYLREERVAKELAGRERDVDTALRSLKTGEVVRLGEVTLKALVEQCRRLQELNEHRRKVEEAEAAARKAQQQRQALMSASSSRSGTPRGGSGASTSGGAKGLPPPPPAKGAAASSSADSSPAPGGRGGVGASGAGKAGGAGGRAGGTSGGAATAVAAAAAAAGGSSPAQGAGSSASGSRRASDPATSASPSSSTTSLTTPSAARASGSAAAAAPAGSGGKGAKAPAAAAAAAAASAPASTPPKPKPTAKAAPAAAAAASTPGLSVAGLLDCGLPPPPPPPPP